jgi:hypothetical protein
MDHVRKPRAAETTVDDAAAGEAVGEVVPQPDGRTARKHDAPGGRRLQAVGLPESRDVILPPGRVALRLRVDGGEERQYSQQQEKQILGCIQQVICVVTDLRAPLRSRG